MRFEYPKHKNLRNVILDSPNVGIGFSQQCESVFHKMSRPKIGLHPKSVKHGQKKILQKARGYFSISPKQACKEKQGRDLWLKGQAQFVG